MIIGIPVYAGVDLLDVMGPYEILSGSTSPAAVVYRAEAFGRKVCRAMRMTRRPPSVGRTMFALNRTRLLAAKARLSSGEWVAAANRVTKIW